MVSSVCNNDLSHYSQLCSVLCISFVFYTSYAQPLFYSLLLSVILNYRGFNCKPSVVGPPLRILHFCSHPLFVKDQPGLCRTMRFGGMVSPKSPSPTKTSPRWEGNRERFGGIERKENE